jgi:endonuclease/exonuclease/phosphatase family metal-dependent hydrolase
MKKIRIDLSKMYLCGTRSLLILAVLGAIFTGCKEEDKIQDEPALSRSADKSSAVTTQANLPKKVMHMNICGNICWSATAPDGGGVESRGSVSRMTKVLAAVDNYDPDIVTFNEICYSQYRAIYTDMIARGYGCTYSSTTTGSKCDDFDSSWGTGAGNAIFSKGPVPNVQQFYLLPNASGAQPRQLLCTDTKVQGVDCKVCTTHLTNDSAYRLQQIKYIANKATSWIAVKPLIITGDFNAQPGDPEMNWMYATAYTNGLGLFQEADEANSCSPFCRGGEYTYNEAKKLDYIFFSAQHFGGLTADAKSRFPNPISDHNCYQGSALWQ